MDVKTTDPIWPAVLMRQKTEYTTTTPQLTWVRSEKRTIPRNTRQNTRRTEWGGTTTMSLEGVGVIANPRHANDDEGFSATMANQTRVSGGDHKAVGAYRCRS
jgi:hypothetical protein